MLRALGEFEIAGMRTTIPAHVALLATADFKDGNHSTKWVEEEVDPATSAAAPAPGRSPWPTAPEEAEPLLERTVPVEVDGRRYSVKVWLPDARRRRARQGRQGSAKPRSAAGGGRRRDGTISAPMQGTIVKVLVAEGDAVELGQAVLVLEAMKMENHINAEKGGTVEERPRPAGDTVSVPATSSSSSSNPGCGAHPLFRVGRVASRPLARRNAGRRHASSARERAALEQAVGGAMASSGAVSCHRSPARRVGSGLGLGGGSTPRVGSTCGHARRGHVLGRRGLPAGARRGLDRRAHRSVASGSPTLALDFPADPVDDGRARPTFLGAMIGPRSARRRILPMRAARGLEVPAGVRRACRSCAACAAFDVAC